MLNLWMPEGDAPWRWCLTGQPWQAASNWDELLSATAALNAREVAVFFPTAAAQLIEQKLTRQQVRQLGDKGLRYSLEEYSLVPVEQLDVRHVQSGEDRVSVLALPQTVVSQYVSALALGPWRLVALLPDFLLIPLVEGRPTLLLDGPVALLRLGPYKAVPAEYLPAVLGHLTTTPTLTVLGEVPPALPDLLAPSGTAIDAVTLPLLPPVQPALHPFNVLPRPARAGLSPYWKAVAVVLLLGVLTQVSKDGVSAWRHHQVAQANRAQAEQLFRQWFPQEPRIVNLKAQMAAHLQQSLAQDIQALTLLSRLGPSLQQSGLPAQMLRYQQGVMELALKARSTAELESLRGLLGQQGLKVELGSVTPAGAGVTGMIKVQL